MRCWHGPSPPSSPGRRGGASTSGLKKEAGLLAMACHPWRALQAICRPAQPAAPALHAPQRRALGAANYPAAVLCPRHPACPEDGVREEEPGDVTQTGKQSSSRYSSSLLPASRRAQWGPHHHPGAKSLSSPRDLAGGGSLMAFLPRHTLFTLNILCFNHEGFPPALQAQLRDSTARRCAAVAASFQSSLLGSPPGIARRISVLTQREGVQQNLHQVQPLIP